MYSVSSVTGVHDTEISVSVFETSTRSLGIVSSTTVSAASSVVIVIGVALSDTPELLMAVTVISYKVDSVSPVIIAESTSPSSAESIQSYSADVL